MGLRGLVGFEYTNVHDVEIRGTIWDRRVLGHCIPLVGNNN